MIFLGLTLSAWVVILTLIVALTVLLSTNVKPSVVFFMIMAVFCILPVMSFEQAFAGMDNSSVLLVGVLYIVIAGMKYSGALEWIVNHLMGVPKNHITAILRLMVPVAALSSVMSNTTTTALFKGVVRSWSAKLQISPSKLLIPLAYAATLGGLLTLIGTTPNLLIASLYTQKTGATMNLFTPFPVALSCIIVDIIVVLLLRRLLPERECPQSDNNGLLDENGNSIAVTNIPKWKTYTALAIIVTMLVVSALNLQAFPLSSCVLVAGILMVMTRCCTSSQAFKEVDWQVILVFAGSVCLGTAIDVTGLGQKITDILLLICNSNKYSVLISLCVLSAFLTEIISDTACGAMFFPIVWQISSKLGIEPMPLLIALMMSISSSFCTPIATPPNLIVYNDGGYRFSDYARIGIPMKVCHIATAIIAVILIYGI